MGETIGAWFNVLRDGGPEIIKHIRAAWGKSFEMLAEESRQIHVTGLMTNLISILVEAR